MTKNELESLIMKIASVVISIAIAVNGYFLKETYSRLVTVENSVIELKINTERTNGNRFTSTDWITNKSLIDQQLVNSDRKIIVLEENQKAIKEILLEIKNDLKELKDDRTQ